MTTTQQGSASIPAIQQYLYCAKDQGVDTDSILKKFDFTQDILQDNTKRIPLTLFQDLLIALINATGDPLFGLKTSQYVQAITYSIYGYMAMNSRNIGDVIKHIPIYEKLVGDMGTSRIVSVKSGLYLQWECNLTDPLARRHVIENVIASWILFGRWISGSDESPLTVKFNHQAPSNRELLIEYDNWFNCPVLFNQEDNGIIMSLEQTQLPVIQADHNIFTSLQKIANRRLTEISDYLPVSAKVKTTLSTLIKSHPPKKEVVASMLGIPYRTLQRRLKVEGHTYQSILDLLRYELAKELLENSSLTLKAIGQRIGFQETRSFHRFFKSYTGTTPGTYRKNNR